MVVSLLLVSGLGLLSWRFWGMSEGVEMTRWDIVKVGPSFLHENLSSVGRDVSTLEVREASLPASACWISPASSGPDGTRSFVREHCFSRSSRQIRCRAASSRQWTTLQIFFREDKFTTRCLGVLADIPDEDGKREITCPEYLLSVAPSACNPGISVSVRSFVQTRQSELPHQR